MLSLNVSPAKISIRPQLLALTFTTTSLIMLWLHPNQITLSLSFLTYLVLYWINKRVKYPRLLRIALDVLSIPPISDKPKQRFGKTRLTVSALQMQLLPDTIAAVLVGGS